MPTHRLLGLFAFVIATTATSLAHADDEPDHADVTIEDGPADAPTQLHVDVSSGFTTLGPQVGALLLVRTGLFEVGPSADATGLVSSKTGGGFAMGLGSHGRERHSFGWDMLGEVGIHHHHAAKGLFSADPGASGSIPYAGMRIGLSWSLGGPRAHVRGRHGLWLYGNIDLTSATTQYEYRETGWLGGSWTEKATTTVGGGALFGLSYTIGFDAS